MSNKIDKDIEKQIISDYNTNVLVGLLCDKYNISKNTLYVILKRNQLKPNKNTQHTYNQEIFNNINENSAYWLGMLFTDGHIKHNPKRGAQIILNLKDKEHLEKLNQFLEASPKLKITTRDHFTKSGQKYYSYFLTFGSNQIAKSIEKYGYNNEIPSKELINNIDFWRGVIDGDGCISCKNKYNSISLGICGSYNLCKSFFNFCKNHIEINTEPRKIKDKNAWQCQINGEKAENIIKLLYYPNCTYYLDRKKQRIKTFFETGKVSPYAKTNYENYNKEIDFLPPKSKES